MMKENIFFFGKEGKEVLVYSGLRKESLFGYEFRFVETEFRGFVERQVEKEFILERIARV